MSRVARIWLAGSLGILLLTAGCSSTPPVAVIPPDFDNAPLDSVRVKLSLQTYLPNGKVETVRAVLWAVPQQRYRLEISGAMGISIGSLLWQDSQWLFNFNTLEQHSQGSGVQLSLADIPLPPLSIHEVFAPWWGAGFTIIPAALPTTELEVRYGSAVILDSLMVPQQVDYFQQGRKILTVQAQEVKRNLAWGAGIWKLSPLGKPRL